MLAKCSQKQCWGWRITSNTSCPVFRITFQVTSNVTDYFLICNKISELLFQISNSYIVSDVLSDSSGVAMVMYWVTALVLPWWCTEWQLWCCHGDVLVVGQLWCLPCDVTEWQLWCCHGDVLSDKLWCCHGDVLSDSSGLPWWCYWVTALVLPWWCTEWQLCVAMVMLLSESSGVAMVMLLSDSSGVAMVMYWVTALVLPWWLYWVTALCCHGWQKSERCVWTWSYCTSRLNVNMHLFSIPQEIWIKTVKCKIRIWCKPAIIKYVK